MKIPHRLRRALRVLFTPSCWLQVPPYSEEWEQTFRYLLAHHHFTDRDQYTAHLGPYEVWVRNHPYGSMSPYVQGGLVNVRPCRATILEAGDQLQAECLQPTLRFPINPTE